VKKILLLILSFLLAGCGEAKKVPVEQPKETAVLDSMAEQGTFTDTRNNKTYKYVKIGEQVWMAENLNYEVEGSKCGGAYKGEHKGLKFYHIEDKNTENCNMYGRLYNWATAMEACPSGWHLPSDYEWYILIDFAGDDTAGKKLKSKTGWGSHRKGMVSGNGTDDYGFSALPGGSGSIYSFHYVGERGFWWTATEYGDKDKVFYRYMFNYYNSVGHDNDDKSDLFSVRCVKN
jgi:uncharacterized protein (TIGR02145 family)